MMGHIMNDCHDPTCECAAAKVQHGGHPRFYEILNELADLHSRKNHDYAAGGNPLGNFQRVADFLDRYEHLNLGDPVVVALVYLMKQLDAAFWLLNQGHESQTGEDIGARLTDVAVYAILAKVIGEEQAG